MNGCNTKYLFFLFLCHILLFRTKCAPHTLSKIRYLSNRAHFAAPYYGVDEHSRLRHDSTCARCASSPDLSPANGVRAPASGAFWQRSFFPHYMLHHINRFQYIMFPTVTASEMTAAQLYIFLFFADSVFRIITAPYRIHPVIRTASTANTTAVHT